MAVRIDVKYRVPDTRAEVKRRYFENLGLGKKVKSVDIVDSYVVDARLPAAQLKSVTPLFANPLVEEAVIGKPQAPARFAWAVEIGFLPGVTDNVGATARETIEDFLKKKFKNGEGVYSSQVFFISGKLSRRDAEAIADSLYNPLIQRAEIKTFRQFKRDGGMGMRVPKVQLRKAGSADRVDLGVSDEELARIGKEGIRNEDGSRRGPLALDLESMKVIRDHFRRRGRMPTDVELESLAQTWSEHCKHTIFADPMDEVESGLYRSYIKAATNEIRRRKGKKDFCVSVFSDNSGAIAFDDEYLVTHKVETHNSPSALDPFGGAVTGIVGVNRDTIGFGLGAKPVANLYGFCLADPRDETVLYRDAAKKQKMLSARRIMEGVVQGINTGGNCSGIPTPQGFLFFDPRYRGKPLVFAGTVGLIPRRVAGKPSHEKRARPGDYVVMLGGRVGQDGIHGATFSSEAMDAKSPATAVQIGDPITQKKLSDALIREARGRGLYHSITDNGAGGLSCSVAEMAKEVRLPAGRQGGCLVELEKVPLKYPGLAPWQIWISESQERMTLAVPKNKWPEFRDLMRRRGVEATAIGRFTASGRCVVKYQGRTVMDVEMSFLHDGRPKKRLTTASAAVSATKSLPKPRDPNATLLKALRHPRITSFEFVSRQYDHEVQASSVLKPLQGRGRVNADTTVLRPVFASRKGIVLSYGMLPEYSEADPYRMAAAAVDTAVRAAVAAGAHLDHLALLDNFCWCSSNEPERLAQLKDAVRACYDYALAYGTPFISGKDSMFNDFKGYDAEGKPVKISVPPTLLISAIGVIPDVMKTVSIDLKFPGDLIYVLGETQDEVDAERNLKLYRALEKCIGEGLVASAISVGRGGLAVALAKTAIAGKLGIDVSLEADLFSESQGGVVVGVAPAKSRDFEKKMKGNAWARIGKVASGGKIVIRGKKRSVRLPVGRALSAYRSTFKNY